MEFVNLEKVGGGKFITRYDATYRTSEGNLKRYEMISRNPNVESLDDIKNSPAEAVVIIAHDETNDKILINKEFRMAVGNYAYNFPAGLIDPGEDARTAAKRELWEETGLDLYEIDEIWPISYSAVGVMNERAIVIIGKARGEFAPSTSAEEEIEAKWFSKQEMRELLAVDTSFAARTQAYCWLWSRE